MDKPRDRGLHIVYRAYQSMSSGLIYATKEEALLDELIASIEVLSAVVEEIDEDLDCRENYKERMALQRKLKKTSGKLNEVLDEMGTLRDIKDEIKNLPLI